ncbi:MAG: 2TM domain-containing protein [Clostridia bacterium]|nr:2TM domain-containing protein [Clostridia bacterium]
MDNNERAYQEAAKAVKERRDFYQHLVVYVAVCTFLSVMTLFVWGGKFWPVFVIFGWGIGVASHAVSTFLGKEWERKKINEYLDKHGDKGEDN